MDFCRAEQYFMAYKSDDTKSMFQIMMWMTMSFPLGFNGNQIEKQEIDAFSQFLLLCPKHLAYFDLFSKLEITLQNLIEQVLHITRTPISLSLPAPGWIVVNLLFCFPQLLLLFVEEKWILDNCKFNVAVSSC